MFKQCKQADKGRLTGEQAFQATNPSSGVGSSSLSSTENDNSVLSHVPEPGMREFKTSHYDAQVNPSWRTKRFKLKQHKMSPRCLKYGDESHYWRDYGVDSGDNSVKQCPDKFCKVKRTSDKREGKNRK